ncbi:uncharacterized protein [Musca autumnalis]|uniref:uncharacterized protein n=1 Tax=Musca autumnalis TaxID=221902 RepID=UPI003CEF4F7A
MKSFRLLAVVCLMVARVCAAPIEEQSLQFNGLFSGISDNTNPGNPPKEGDIVKRRIYEENSDRHLKQISLQSLISNFEDSLFASALSVSDVAVDQSAEITEIKPNAEEVKGDHGLKKRDLDVTTTATPIVDSITATPIPVEGEERKVILQTTERIPASAGVPTHIIIDRIEIQPQHGTNIPLLPTFEIRHNHKASGENKPEITKISISKTEIKSVPNSTATPDATTTSTAETDTATVPTTSSTPKETESTTAKNIEQLKEEEQELKDKVAEIEAEPVILSARV